MSIFPRVLPDICPRDRDAPTKILILIPTLAVGGAEMDLLRNLPRIDRARFKIVVCTFLERARLAERLIDAGIEVIGPFGQWSHRWQRLRSLARQLKRYLGPLTRPLQVYLRSIASRFPFLARALAFVPNLARQVLAVLGEIASGPRIFLGIALPIARYIRVANIDLVHTVLPNAYLIGVLANSLAKWRPLVMSRLSLNWYQETHRTLGVIERYLLHRLVDCAIGNSKAILNELRREGLPESKLLLVHNGIDVAAFTGEMVDRAQARHRIGISQNSLVLSSVANLFPYKGHEDMFNALHCLLHRLPQEWALLAIGGDIDGNMAELRRLSRELGLSRHVHFLGQRLDVCLILSAADIHVSASHYEGFPNNILEAMCVGLPVIATAVGGVPELVVDGHTGLLVPAKSPARIAGALSLLANDPARRRAMGAAGRTRVESHFTIERSVAAFEDIYASMMARRRF